MVCTYTNVAVDNLVEGFAKAGLNPLRIGYGKVRSSLLDHTLEAQMLKHPLAPKLKSVSEERESAERQYKALGVDILRIKTSGTASQLKRLDAMEKNYHRLENRTEQLGAKEYGIHQEMLSDIVRKADVVCPLLNLIRPVHVLLGLHNLHHFSIRLAERHRFPSRVPG
jgi:hypothetical protein